MKINDIPPLMSKFTEVLETIALKPKMLYYYGKMPENRPKIVAIVGTRKNTPYGQEIAYKLAYELTKRGAIIVSGLAIGCDGIAHRGCLDAGGITVGILGTPINHIHPASHTRLAEEIVEKGGCIISEYGVGAKTYASSFLERNRLIAGLSDVVIVIEANERSGSLNTASHALEQNKELWAVPGDITRPLSKGCNKLIAQGANPVISIEDAIEAICPSPKHKKDRLKKALSAAETPAEAAILTALKHGIRDGEEMIKQGIITAVDFNITITTLEIRGVVKPLGLNNWTII